MISRHDLTAFLDDLLLAPAVCRDTSNNGLQVEGRDSVRKVAFGVDACIDLFEKAAAVSADYIIVHHGMSWGDSLKYLRAVNGARARSLFHHDLSLYAAHLPLDMHPEVGHNAQIADMLALINRFSYFEYGGADIGVAGDVKTPITVDALAARVNACLDTRSTIWDFGGGMIRRVGVVSGGGADGIEACPARQIDCLITGEVHHQHWHVAKELGIHVIAAGHYKTECPGLFAVQKRLERRFGLDCEFIDIPTGL
ncbi:MAG: Nif3-like dinuclear metal center hexameric protein [Lentisphaeria bacterium]|nr:Nif3-like dinuclear metal center hexameric protein [Lentisphaeria bacterium]